ncbi:response regulator [bacterium]|nr:response regulator [bacterium]
MLLRKIIIIDRDKKIAELLESCFKAEGYLTYATNSVDHVLEYMEGSRTDILVVDSLLPDDGAYTLLRNIRQKPEGRILPIALIISSRPVHADRQTFLMRQFRVPLVIKKPYRISTLLKTIDTFFASSETRSIPIGQLNDLDDNPSGSTSSEDEVKTITTEPDDYIELIEPDGGEDVEGSDSPERPDESSGTASVIERQTMAEAVEAEQIEELTEEVDERRHIVVVDDEPTILKILTRLFETEGFRVSMTHKSTEAMKLVATEKPDVVISDIMMPELDGYSLCRIIKSKPELAKTKVILLTAKNLTQDKGEGFKSGADFFMQKPINRQKLVSVVKSLLNLAEQG